MTNGHVVTPALSVVIPTYERPALLERCIRAVLGQVSAAPFEVVVANDGATPVPAAVAGDPRVVVLDGPFGGPAAARNAGVAAARSPIIVFTDDDCEPQPGWLDAARARFAAEPGVVGVAGLVECPDYDPLFEHAVSGAEVGNFLTCNIAYRRAALREVGGFDEQFQFPHCEDRDLGYRVERVGPVVYEPSMRVAHPSRAVGIADVVRRGRFVASEWRLHTKHPQTRPARWSLRWGPVVGVARHWQRLATERSVIGGDARRAARLAAMATGQLAVAVHTTVTQWGAESARSVAEARAPRSGLRIAYVGPEPRPGAGVAGCAWLVVRGLTDLGCTVDCYLAGLPQETQAVREVQGARVVHFDSGWRYGRWYSRSDIGKFLSAGSMRALARRRLTKLLVQQHRAAPYDVVYQFSSIELFGLRAHLDALPPLLLHPEVHAAGELRWLRGERALAARCEPRWKRATVELAFTYRAWRQRRDASHARGVIAISRVFGRHLEADCSVEAARVRVVPNPIDLERIVPPAPRQVPGPLRVLFVGRMSVRKGVEQVVALSERLHDLAGRVRIECVGGGSQWSDYRPLLRDLDPDVATYVGEANHEGVRARLADAALLVQPAKYEPFGLTVGEALASGVPVVVTTEVGAGEGVDPSCCTVVTPGDLDALEDAVREMLARIEADGDALRARARREAEIHFDPKRVARLVLDALEDAARR